jgi:hypothetical protein
VAAGVEIGEAIATEFYLRQTEFMQETGLLGSQKNGGE